MGLKLKSFLYALLLVTAAVGFSASVVLCPAVAATILLVGGFAVLWFVIYDYLWTYK